MQHNSAIVGSEKMFVTCDHELFKRLTSKNATLAKEDKKSLFERNRQLLINLLVKGEHRFKKIHTRRTKQELAALNKTQRAQPHDISEEDQQLLDNLGQLVDQEQQYAIKEAQIVKNITAAENLLNSVDILSLKELQGIRIQLDKAASKNDTETRSEEIGRNIDNLFTRLRKKTGDTKDSIKFYRKEIRNIGPDVDTTTARESVKEYIDVLNEIASGEGDRVFNQSRNVEFVSATEDEIVRCQSCADAHRFPTLWLDPIDDQYLSRDYIKTVAPNCKCKDQIDHLVIMSDVMMEYLKEMRQTDDASVHVNIFLPFVDEIFVFKNETKRIRLQFIYLHLDNYRGVRLHKSQTAIPDLSDLDLGLDDNNAQPDPIVLQAIEDPYRALQEYINEGLDIENLAAEADPEQLQTDVTLAPTSTLLSAFGAVGTFFGNALGLSPAATQSDETPTDTTIAMPETTVQYVTPDGNVKIGSRSMSRKDMYINIVHGMDRFMKQVFQGTSVKCEFTNFASISGNTRMRLAIDAEITLTKIDTDTEFILIAPANSDPYMSMMQNEMALLNKGSKSVLHVQPGQDITWKPNGTDKVVRALVVDDTIRTLSSYKPITDKYALLFQRLHIDGMIIFVNCTPDDPAIAGLGQIYNSNPKGLTVEAAKGTLSLDNADCLVCFFSETERNRLQVSAISTYMLTSLTRIDSLMRMRKERVINFLVGIKPEHLLDIQVLPELDDDLPPAQNEPLSIELRKAVMSLDPVISESLFTIDGPSPTDSLPPLPSIVPLPTLFPPLAVPSSDGGSRLWRSGAQLDIMLRQ
jgi:hypothetical protein